MIIISRNRYDEKPDQLSRTGARENIIIISRAGTRTNKTSSRTGAGENNNDSLSQPFPQILESEVWRLKNLSSCLHPSLIGQIPVLTMLVKFPSET
jgi:hypothetical protein